MVKPKDLPTPSVVKMLRDRFLTRERSLALARKWEGVSLSGCMSKYPGKLLRETTEPMVAHIQELQGCLPPAYNSDEMLCAKLLNAISGVEACRIVPQKPAATVEGVISDIYTSIATYKAPESAAPVTALFTDRKRRGDAPRGNRSVWEGRRRHAGCAERWAAGQ